MTRARGLGTIQLSDQQLQTLRGLSGLMQTILRDTDRIESAKATLWPSDQAKYMDRNPALRHGSDTDLATILSEQSLAEIHDNNVAAALHSLRAILTIANATKRLPVNDICAPQITELIADVTFEQIEPELDWNNPITLSESRLLLRSLQLVAHSADLSELWKKGFLRDGWTFSRQERTSAWALNPLVLDAEARALHARELNLPAVEARTLPGVNSLALSPLPSGEDALSQLICALSSPLDERPQDGARPWFAVASANRAMAIILAAHLFRHDHNRFPDSASELVPAYHFRPFPTIHSLLATRRCATGWTPLAQLLGAWATTTAMMERPVSPHGVTTVSVNRILFLEHPGEVISPQHHCQRPPSCLADFNP